MIAIPSFAGCTFNRYESREVALRARRIGASDSAGIFGVGYDSQSAFAFVEGKLSGKTTIEETERMRIGTDLEPGLRKIFERNAKLPCYDLGPHVLTSNDCGYMTATLDGFCDVPHIGIVPAELKNVDARLMKEWVDGPPPLKFEVQCNHQMYVTGCDRAYIMALIGGNTPIVKIIYRNQPFIDAMVKRNGEIWAHVLDRTMPPIDDSVATAKVLARLHPDDDGSTIQLPPEAAHWAENLAAAKAAKKEAESKERLAKNQLTAAIGDATYGELPGIAKFSYKTQGQAEHVVKAAKFRVLRKAKL